MQVCFKSSTAPDGFHKRRNKHSTIFTLCVLSRSSLASWWILRTGSLEIIILHMDEVKFQNLGQSWDEVKGARSPCQASRWICCERTDNHKKREQREKKLLKQETLHSLPDRWVLVINAAHYSVVRLTSLTSLTCLVNKIYVHNKSNTLNLVTLLNKAYLQNTSNKLHMWLSALNLWDTYVSVFKDAFWIYACV
jgi:hypothetical protein